MEAVRYQLNKIADALFDLAEGSTDSQLVSEYHSILKEITTSEFVISLVVLYDTLIKINAISKMWQSEKLHLDIALRYLDAFLNWLDDYRENGFQSALSTAREIAEEIGIGKISKVQRRRHNKRNFDYEEQDEASHLTQEELFKINYFYVVVDTVRGNCQPRFEALKQYESTFGFLYTIKELRDMDEAEILKYCSDLQVGLSIGGKSDIDGIKLCVELKMFSAVYDNQDHVASVLKYIVSKNFANIYPTPVTVASTERNLSRLKLIKTYLRNSKTQERLDYTDLIEDFSNQEKSQALMNLTSFEENGLAKSFALGPATAKAAPAWTWAKLWIKAYDWVNL